MSISDFYGKRNDEESLVVIHWAYELGIRFLIQPICMGRLLPIPGTKRIKYMEENISALNVSLTQQDLEVINAIAPKCAAAGMRYPETMMSSIGK